MRIISALFVAFSVFTFESAVRRTGPMLHNSWWSSKPSRTEMIRVSNWSSTSPTLVIRLINPLFTCSSWNWGRGFPFPPCALLTLIRSTNEWISSRSVSLRTVGFKTNVPFSSCMFRKINPLQVLKRCKNNEWIVQGKNLTGVDYIRVTRTCLEYSWKVSEGSPEHEEKLRKTLYLRHHIVTDSSLTEMFETLEFPGFTVIGCLALRTIHAWNDQ